MWEGGGGRGIPTLPLWCLIDSHSPPSLPFHKVGSLGLNDHCCVLWCWWAHSYTVYLVSVCTLHEFCYYSYCTWIFQILQSLEQVFWNKCYRGIMLSCIKANIYFCFSLKNWLKRTTSFISQPRKRISHTFEPMIPIPWNRSSMLIT